MRRVALMLKLTVLVTLCLSTPSQAKTIAETVTEWGLIGTWAIDCKVPPDRQTGTRLAYVVKSGGRVVHERDFGDTSDTNEVLQADLASDNSIVLRVRFTALKDTRQYALMKMPDGTIRAFFNRGGDGVYTIKDGRFVANDQLSPKQFRCD
jgi:hypothetical protein